MRLCRPSILVTMLAAAGSFALAAGCGPAVHRPRPNIIELADPTAPAFDPPQGSDGSESSGIDTAAGGIVEEIRVPPCGFFNTFSPLKTKWGSFGSRTVLESDAGQRLTLECVNAFSPTYHLWFDSPETGRVLVGECPFEGGCNYATFRHTGDSDGNGRPDRLLSTQWVSKDYGFEDGNRWYDPEGSGPDGLLDHAEFNFDAVSGRFALIVRKYEYRPGVWSLRCSEVGEKSTTPVKSLLIEGWKSETVPDDDPRQ